MYGMYYVRSMYREVGPTSPSFLYLAGITMGKMRKEEEEEKGDGMWSSSGRELTRG